MYKIFLEVLSNFIHLFITYLLMKNFGDIGAFLRKCGAKECVRLTFYAGCSKMNSCEKYDNIKINIME